jgi:hypothetical protein
VLDALYGPLYYRFLVKNEPPARKYAEALADLVLIGLVQHGYRQLERNRPSIGE